MSIENRETDALRLGKPGGNEHFYIQKYSKTTKYADFNHVIKVTNKHLQHKGNIDYSNVENLSSLMYTLMSYSVRPRLD